MKSRLISIEEGEEFVRRKGKSHDIAIVVYRSADNSVGYRLKGSRRIYNCAPVTFLRNWKPIGSNDLRG